MIGIPPSIARATATRVENGNTNRFFYDYALALRPIAAERDNNTASYPHCDRVGSILALTDGNGSVADAYACDAYGRILSQTGTNGQPFRFTGRLGARHTRGALDFSHSSGMPGGYYRVQVRIPEI